VTLQLVASEGLKLRLLLLQRLMLLLLLLLQMQSLLLMLQVVQIVGVHIARGWLIRIRPNILHLRQHRLRLELLKLQLLLLLLLVLLLLMMLLVQLAGGSHHVPIVVIANRSLSAAVLQLPRNALLVVPMIPIDGVRLLSQFLDRSLELRKGLR